MSAQQLLRRAALAASLLFAAPALADDCLVESAAVLHDTFDPFLREPPGPVPVGTAVKLRVRVAQGDLTSARLWVVDGQTGERQSIDLMWDGAFDHSEDYDWWWGELPASAEPGLKYYAFELIDTDPERPDCEASVLYGDDDPRFSGGGSGVPIGELKADNGFQVSVYDPAFAAPAWLKGGVVYQVFPDRFRNGDPSNDRPAGSYHYGQGSILRSNQEAWNSKLCDPFGEEAPTCRGHWSDNFYGGDLDGVTEKVNAGYFDALGVSVLYLNPIFRSPSNHRYDTSDFSAVDDDLGGEPAFLRLVAAAKAHGLEVVLDGVFNHVSSDSVYFDRDSRYDAEGRLSAQAGVNDGSGACESETSPYRGWFYFPGFDRPANHGNDKCAGDVSYEAWWGFGSMPKLNTSEPEVRALFFTEGRRSVGPGWVAKGAAGFRMDVGADIDGGAGSAKDNDFWERFRLSLRDVAVTGRADTLILGEEWGDASAWLLGREWDSVMNYRFRSAALAWLFAGCRGEGCQSGAVFEDADSNGASPLGAIRQIPPSVLNARLKSIAEDYPPEALKAMMNLVGSHDTNRVRFLLQKGNHDDRDQARVALRELFLLQFSYVGAPAIYMGDEVGIEAPGRYTEGKWQDDPFNRAPFPWDDTPGHYQADQTLLREVQTLASIRWAVPALQDGDVVHGVVVDDAQEVYGFARVKGASRAVVLLCRAEAGATLTLSPEALGVSEGAVFKDALSGETVTVRAGARLSIPARGGRVLVAESDIETPAALTGLSATRTEAGVALSWPIAWKDTEGGREVIVRYDVYRAPESQAVPVDDAHRVATVTPPAFGGPVTLVDPADEKAWSYVVVARNALGRGRPSAPVSVAAGETPSQPQDGSPVPPGADAGSTSASSGGGCQQGPSSLGVFGVLALLAWRWRRVR